MAVPRERVGRPTQFHGVPLEERAFDSQGNRLPWALEWADGHPNARHQKRQPEEKGSFGKSLGRKGSSRATRTQTPAKKENHTLDSFEAALRFDADVSKQREPSAGSQGIPDVTQHTLPSLTKEPMQVILYGYAPEMQWAAIQHYESISGGIICEDYEREPPVERRRFQNGLSHNAHVHPRPLSRAESLLAMHYKGGNCWIKVTFDSIEAGERAIYNQPHQINGYWVYAQPFHGQGREVDEPIPVEREDFEQGLLAAPKPRHRPSQTLGSSFAPSSQWIASNPRATSTLPRNFSVAENDIESSRPPIDVGSLSPSTASSGTALDVEYPQIRQRNPSQLVSIKEGNDDKGAQGNTGSFTHFPETRRTVLRPAADAFLPQPTWTERLLIQLSGSGLIPGDVIGNSVPRLENGDFDWFRASFYWKICYWLDTQLGTDLCGMKEG